ncbi:IS110 family transposase, partial [bacterium]|nr:IS110 family transposase [bacterium]
MADKLKMAQDRPLAAGLDVDRRGSVISVLDPSNGEIVFEGKLAHDIQTWQRFLARFPECRIGAFYEAGPLGYTLCRRLRSLGVDCQVVAPS